VSSRSYFDVLDEGLLPYYEPGDIFVQGNARVHVMGCTPEWLEEHGIWTIDWPPHSLDLNPTEHVWHALKKKKKRYGK
jgi:transposase